MNAELSVLLRIAGEAARVIMEVYARPFDVDYKGPQDPVTEADRRANALICERLEQEFPGVPIVAEESDPATFSQFRKHDRVFFVDPVDGTREFVDRNGEFAVMIGLVEGAHAIASVIDAPARGEIFAGWVGQGAVRIRDGKREAIRVSEIGDISQGRLVGSRSHRGPALERALERLNPREVVVMGSAGLKGTLVASGQVEAYVAPGYAGQRWDACAADALVTAAGGKLTDTHGDPIDYRAPSLSNDRGLLASNGRVHEALVDAFADLRQG
jgi:3'(2'), 5'-bisphosphate nucleotidase